MNKKILTAGVAFTAIALSTLTFASINSGAGTKADFEAVKTAVESGTYANLPAIAKTKITEAQFADMVAKSAAKTAEQAAIDAKDYAAYRAAKIAQIPTEPVFNTMADVQQAQKTAQAAIEAAIKANDFTAFKKAHTDLQAALTTLKPGSSPKVPTDAQMQKQFDKFVKQYSTDGSLPKGPGREGIMGMGMGMGMGKDNEQDEGDHMGKGGQRGNGNK